MRRPWVLPTLLGAVQLALWPGVELLLGGAPGLLRVVGSVLLVIVTMTALCWRRSAVMTALPVVVLAGPASAVLAPAGQLLGVAVAQLIMQYHVGMRRPRRDTALAYAAFVSLGSVPVVVQEGFGWLSFGDVVFSAVVFVIVAVLGRRRREWLAERAAASARLAEADRRRRRAADDERHRLARELHDVTAHHLTSIVVTATAAQRLGERRPELVPEALGFSARTGRATLAALHRLVAVMQTAGAADGAGVADRLTELADGFRRLGQRVELDLAAVAAPPAVADAAYGIAREALTNTLRYAPGATVRVTLHATAGGLDVTVADDGSAAASAAASVGSGRGVAGMRDRAAALGGTLTAGPRPTGGWQVRAHLPYAAEPAAPAPPQTWWHRWRAGDWAVNACLAVGAAALPVGIAAANGRTARGPGAAGVLVLLAVLHAVPLLWRRRHPWRTLTVVVGIGVLWPAALAADLVAADMEWIYLVGVAAEFLALHAVATHGRPTEWTWLAPIGTSIAMSLSFGVAVGFGVRRDGALADTDSAVAAAALTAVVFGGGLFIITLLVWLSGFLPRHRRETTVTWEANAVAAALAAAQSAAAAERHRVFVGLRGEVLDRTAQVEAAAVRGELDTVVEQARAALAAMRGLLNGLRPVEPAQRDPQPGTAAVASLAERQRAAGRPVSVQVDGAPRALPADVDVSAYRLVELALGAGDGPATVRLEYGPSRLDLILTGVPAADDDHVGSGLRARVAAVGGTLRRTGPGAVHIRLPAPRPAPNEEVTPSASA